MRPKYLGIGPLSQYGTFLVYGHFDCSTALTVNTSDRSRSHALIFKIFITTPSPKILKTLLEFIFKGTDVLGYEEHLDYDIAQSTNPDFNKAFVRVNIFKHHHEIIQVSLLSYFQSSNPDSLS